VEQAIFLWQTYQAPDLIDWALDVLDSLVIDSIAEHSEWKIEGAIKLRECSQRDIRLISM
jgi:hypothetical protein